jgi:hypothetical protein
MDPLSIELTLAETAAARQTALTSARAAMAVPLRLLAVAWIALCPVALIIGRDHLGPFVGLALLAVTVIAWRRYEHAADQTGLRARLWPWLAVAFVALAGGVITSRGGTEMDLPWVNAAGPFLVNAAALGCLAWLVNSRVLAIATAVMAAVSIVVAALFSGDLAVATQLALFALLLLGASSRMDT